MNRISTRILVLFVANVIVWVSLLGLFFYWIAARSIEKQVDSTLKTTATVLASQWDGGLLVALRPGMESAALYRSFSEQAKRFKEATRVEGIYIAAPDRSNIISSEPELRIGQPLPRLDLLQSEVQEALHGTTSASRLVEVNKRLYKSAVAPIYSGEKIVALLVVDMSPDYLVYVRTFRNSLFVFTAVALLFCILSARLFSRTITTPLSRMVQRVEEIGKAQYETPLEVTGSDELSKLGSSIESMRRNILHRDARMKMMLSGIAHEIRNPLGGMELFTGILEKEKLDPEQLEYVRKIKSEIRNLERLLNEFLDFARPQKMECEAVPLPELMSEIRDMMEGEWKEKGVVWVLQIEPGVETVQADRARLRQALLNLYRNACQATPDDGRVLSQVRKNGTGIILEITNSQPGKLDPETAAKIFEPFFTTREKGMGLGLPLARQIIESHGGELNLVRNEEEFITFAVKLPSGVGS